MQEAREKARAAAFKQAMAAARNGSMKLVQEWLATGHIDTVDEDGKWGGWTLLHAAAAANQKHIVAFLLSKGACVNAVTVRGHTALHLAALDSHEDMCRMLLEHAANPLLLTSVKLGSQTAKDIAILFDRQSLVCLLDDAERRYAGSDKDSSRRSSSSRNVAAGVNSSSSRQSLADFAKWNKTDWDAIDRETDLNLSAPTARRPAAPSSPAPQFPAAHAVEPESSYKSDPNRLMSFRPPPEGGSAPNASDGGFGPPLPLLQGGGDGGVCYTWGQTLKSATITIEVGRGVSSKDIRIVFATQSITVCIPANLPCARAWSATPQQLWAPVAPLDCTWSFDGAGTVEIHLAKQRAAYWRCVVAGHPLIDSTLCRGPDVLAQLDDDGSKNEAINVFSKMFSRLGASASAGGAAAR